MQDKITYLYVIECDSKPIKPIKIGIAFSPEKRVEELQTGCPFPLRLKMKIPMDDRKSAANFEWWLHRHFGRHRMQGEWFDSRKVNLKKAFGIYADIKDKDIKKAKVNYEDSHGSAVKAREKNLQHENWTLKQKIKSLEEEIDGYLDSKIELPI